MWTCASDLSQRTAELLVLSVTPRQRLHCLLRLSLVTPMARGASCSIQNFHHNCVIHDEFEI